MRTSLFSIAIIVLLWSVGCDFTMAKSAISNETGAGKATAVSLDDEWKGYYPKSAAGKGFYVKSDVSQSNGKSLLIDIPAGTEVNFFHYDLDIKTIKTGQMYEYTVWVKTDNADIGVGAMTSLSGIDKTGKRFVSADSERLWGTKDWTYLETVLFVPEDAEKIRLSFYLHGTGKAWFDEPKLRLLSTKPSAKAVKSINIEVTDRKTVPAEQYIGFGLEDDCFFYLDDNFRHGITDAEIELREHRIEELDPKVISTIFWWKSMCPKQSLDEITYDTKLMRMLYRTLDTHQTAGREVVFSAVFWGWLEKFPYTTKDLELAVQTYVNLFDHLINEKGYTCIKTVSVSGEVDMRWEREFGGTLESYIKACWLLRKGLDARGLGGLKIVGDKVSGTVWFERVIAAADDCYDIFTVHEYPDVTQYPVVRERLERALAAIHKHSKPIGKSSDGPIYKPTFLWEIGYVCQGAGDPAGESSVNRTFRYGLLCAHTCNASLNAGIVGGSIWNLQQMYYPGAPKPQTWGLWDFKDNGWQIRPIYYAYGLYSRFSETGSQPLEVKTTPRCYDFSSSAVSDKDGNRMLYLTNLSDSEVVCKINGLAEMDYTIYEYSENSLPKPSESGYGKINALRTGKNWNPSNGKLTIGPSAIVLIK